MIYARRENENIIYTRDDTLPRSSPPGNEYIPIAEPNANVFEKNSEWRFLEMLEFTDSLITIKSEINRYDMDFLTAIKDIIDSVVDNRQQSAQELKEKEISMRIEYDHSNEIQKKPYVAKLSIPQGSYLKRDFFDGKWNTARFEDKMLTVCEFKGKIKIGDVIEMREAPIANGQGTDLRKYYLVMPKGLKSIVWGGYIKEYLKMYGAGVISLNTFLQRMLISTTQNAKQSRIVNGPEAIPDDPYTMQQNRAPHLGRLQTATPPPRRAQFATPTPMGIDLDEPF